jgi:hypothetical protein
LIWAFGSGGFSNHGGNYGQTTFSIDATNTVTFGGGSSSSSGSGGYVKHNSSRMIYISVAILIFSAMILI